MIRCDQYGVFTPKINPQKERTFEDGQEAAFRRLVRQHIRKGPLTKSERDVTLAFFNHWFHHRKKGAVHPGREKLAKKAKVSIATVKRTLSMLRQQGVLIATAHERGLNGKATEYLVNPVALYRLCDHGKRVISVNGGSNDPTSGRVKMTHRLYDTNIVPFPSQKGKTDA